MGSDRLCSPTRNPVITLPKAPGQAYRKGITLMELAEMFPDEESAFPWFEDRFWPNVRFCGHCGSANTKGQPRQDALLVHRLPVLLQHQDGHAAGVHAVATPQVGLRHPSACHPPEGPLQPETASGDRGFAAGDVVHAAAHPPSLRRLGRGRRDLCGWQGQEHACPQAGRVNRTRRRGQDGRSRPA